jgi:hypothetical protein
MGCHLVVALILIVYCKHDAVVHLDKGLLELLGIGLLAFLLGKGINSLKAVLTYL